jgi:hypothetical protein
LHDLLRETDSTILWGDLTIPRAQGALFERTVLATLDLINGLLYSDYSYLSTRKPQWCPVGDVSQ